MNEVQTLESAIRSLIAKIVPESLIRAISWGMVDQAIISGTNFLVMIAAARALGPSSFGIFALLVTVLVFAESIQRALITTPHNVIGVRKEGDDYVHYTSSVAMLQVGAAAGTALVVTFIAIAALWLFPSYAGLLIALGFAIFSWQWHEFTRRVLYTEFRISRAVVLDVVTYIARLGIVGFLIFANELTATRLLILYGLTWLVGGLFGFWSIRASLTRTFDRSVIRHHWSFGRWIFASNAASHIPRYVAAAVLSSTLSVAAYGGYRAFEQLSNGANVPLNALSNVLRPRLARDAKNGPDAVWKTMLPMTVIASITLLIFAIVLIILRDPLIRFIYGSEFTQFSAAIVLVAFLPLVVMQKSMLIKALQAFRDTQPIFIGTIMGGVVGSLVGGIALVIFGLPAAGAIMLLFNLVSVGWLSLVWRRYWTDGDSWTTRIDGTPETQIHR